MTKKYNRYLLTILLTLLFHVPAFSTPQNSPILFNEKGYILEQGQPQFPVGIYVAFYPHWLETDPDTLNANLKDLQDSPFDFLINYGGNQGTHEQIRRYYQLLDQHHLREFFNLTKYYRDMDVPEWKIEFEGTEQQVITSFVNLLKDSPALAGWYIFDEHPQNPESPARHHRWIKEIDPLHPTFVLSNERTTERYRKYLNACDIFGIDCYPVARRSMIDVAHRMDALIEATQNQHPAWFLAQTFGWYMYKIPAVRDQNLQVPIESIARGPDRPVTPEEIRCMSYLALVHGATGLSYYYHKDIMLSYDAQTRWAAVKKIARDIKDISPILTAETVVFDPNLPYSESMSADNLSIHWMMKKYQDKFYLIAVNTSRQLQSNYFNRIPWNFQQANVIQGDCFAYALNNQFLIILDGLETAVVELQQ